MPTQRQLARFSLGSQPQYPGSPRQGGSMLDLIMAQGQRQAEAAQQQGQIWGSALQNIGAQVGGAIQQHGEEQKLKKRDAAWLGVVNDPELMKDPRAAYAKATQIWGPQDGPKQFQALAAVHQLGQEKRDPERDTKAVVALYDGLNGLDAPGRAASWGQVRPLLKSSLGFDPGEQYDDEKWTKVYGPAIKSLRGGKAEEAYTLGPNDKRFKGDKLVAENVVAPKPEKGPAVGSFEDYVSRTAGPSPTPEQILAARKAYNQSDDRPRITVNAGSGGSNLSPTAESNIINRLSTQWDRASKTAVELDRQGKLMDSGLAAARRGDMAAGSQAVLVTFQKILDPTSVVRESEYARSAEGQSLLNRMQGAYQRMVSGGAGVPLDELEAYSKLAKEMTAASTGHLKVLKERLGKTADRYRIPRDLVIDDSMTPSDAGGGPPAQRLTKEQYDAAPSGTQYIAPDGTLKRKR